MALYFQHGITLNRIHDTQAAHSLEKSESKQISYIRLCRYHGYSVSKMLDQKNNIYKTRPNFWKERPLSNEMIDLAAEDVKFPLLILKEQVRQMDKEEQLLFQKACQNEIKFLIRNRIESHNKVRLQQLPEILAIETNQVQELDSRKRILKESESTIKELTAKMPNKKKNKKSKPLGSGLGKKWRIQWIAKLHRMEQNIQLQESGEDLEKYDEIDGINRQDIEMYKVELEENHYIKVMKVNSSIDILNGQINQLQKEIENFNNKKFVESTKKE